MTLRSALVKAATLRRRAEMRPLDYWRPLPGQHQLLEDNSQYRLFRGPNQAIGKTTAGAVDITCTATGDHPWCPEAVTPFPIEGWVICASWSQSVAIQKKLWELLPKDLLHPNTRFTETWGFAPSKSPIVQIRHLPSGGWSTIRIKTTNQGGLNLAGATIQYAWFDEPPKTQRVFTEVQKRVMKAGRWGRVLLTMTPVNASIDWIKKMADEEAIVDHHHRLEPHELIPVGSERPIALSDGTLCDAEWIAKVRAETPEHERPVVCDGEWYFLSDAPRFPAFKTAGSQSHVVTREQVPTHVEYDIWMGGDHGHADHAEVFILVAVQPALPMPKIWVLGEYVSVKGTTSMDDDARGIQDLLKRWGQTWSPDCLMGVNADRAHHWGGKGRKAALQRKSNDDLTDAWERLTGEKPNPPIELVKRGAANLQGAADYGVRFLHQLMLRPGHFNIVDECDRGILSIQRYKGKPNSEWSHWVDALRYALRRYIYDPPDRDGEGNVLQLW